MDHASFAEALGAMVAILPAPRLLADQARSGPIQGGAVQPSLFAALCCSAKKEYG